jgi:hypothetical protein
MAHRLIGTALQAVGWRHTPVPDEVVSTRYQWGTAEVEFTFMTTDSDGRAVIPLPDNPVVWSAEPLGNERRELGGVNSRTIPLALLRPGKSSAREGSAEGGQGSLRCPGTQRSGALTTSMTSSVSAGLGRREMGSARRLEVRDRPNSSGSRRPHCHANRHALSRQHRRATHCERVPCSTAIGQILHGD